MKLEIIKGTSLEKQGWSPAKIIRFIKCIKEPPFKIEGVDKTYSLRSVHKKVHLKFFDAVTTTQFQDAVKLLREDFLVHVLTQHATIMRRMFHLRRICDDAESAGARLTGREGASLLKVLGQQSNTRWRKKMVKKLVSQHLRM